MHLIGTTDKPHLALFLLNSDTVSHAETSYTKRSEKKENEALMTFFMDR